jgi:hypothetical protein
MPLKGFIDNICDIFCHSWRHFEFPCPGQNLVLCHSYHIITTIVFATIAINQIIGPIIFKWGLLKSGEIKNKLG